MPHARVRYAADSLNDYIVRTVCRTYALPFAQPIQTVAATGAHPEASHTLCLTLGTGPSWIVRSDVQAKGRQVVFETQMSTGQTMFIPCRTSRASRPTAAVGSGAQHKK